MATEAATPVAIVNQARGRARTASRVASLAVLVLVVVAYVIIGACEKIPGTIGTMFNTQIYFGPDGSLIGKHQKIMPTVGERLVTVEVGTLVRGRGSHAG